jgi:hypothetical protein
LRGDLHRLIPIARLADNFDLRIVLQHAPESAPYQDVIVHQQH